MNKQAGNYSQPSLSTALHVHHDYSLDHHQHQRRPQQQQQAMRLPFPFPRVDDDGGGGDDDDDGGETSVTGNHNVNNGMVMMSSTHTHHDYMLINNNNNKNNNNIHPAHDQQISTTTSDACLHKLSFEDQFASDFGGPDCKNQSASAPKIITSSDQYHHHHQDQVEANNIDPVYFLKFPVLLNHKDVDHDHHQGQQPADDHLIMAPPPAQLGGAHDQEEAEQDQEEEGGGGGNSVQLLKFAVGVGDELEVDDHVNIGDQNNTNNNNKKVMKRKRGRSIKTSEEVESQRMTHIAVERNRRKQMNEHLRVLRSLMPGSYVQRGDQASIIGGAIEFVRELEQLLQCLESQKRRRLINMQGDNNSITSMPIMQMPLIMPIQQQQHDDDQVPPIFFPAPHHDHLPIITNDDDHRHVLVLQQDHNFDQQTTTGGSGNTSTTLGLLEREETAEKKSSLADVEVKVIGFDAMIKILSRRRPGQLIHIIAALQDLHLNILHTNITTIEQTVLYSFNVKVASECRFTAEDIASSVQQIFAFIHANTTV